MITTPKRYYILGATGFIGKHVAATLSKLRADIVELNRPRYDFKDPQSLFDLDYEDSIIIDCATLADGDEAEIQSVVLNGPKKFVDFLAGTRVRYIYFSTSTVTHEKVVQENAYVRCKKEMEKSILNLDDSTIIRLSLPYGPGESPNRLISRLTSKVAKGEAITIGDIRLPLTPLPFLIDNLQALFQSKKRIINFSDGAAYQLMEVVEAIFSALNIHPEYQLDSSNKDDLTISDPDIYPNTHDPIMLIKQMARTS